MTAQLDAALDRFLAAGETLHRGFRGLFGPGADAKAIAGLEEAIGRELPPELRHLLGRLSALLDKGVLPFGELLAPEGIHQEWTVMEDLRLTEWDPEGVDCEPQGTIKGDKWWRPDWIAIAVNGAGDSHCVDLDPAPGGAVGQVIQFWHDEASRAVLAPSLAAYFDGIATEIGSGDIVWSDEFGGLAYADEV